MHKYLVAFERNNFRFKPVLTERVFVMIEFESVDYTNYADCVDKDRLAWDALWKQYPQWVSKYNDYTDPPKNIKKALAWSSPLMRDWYWVGGKKPKKRKAGLS